MKLETIKETYLAAQFPNRYRVLFWKLKPLSLGHALLLEWLESPFVTAARLPNRLDCALVIALCSRNLQQAERLARSRIIRWHLRRFMPFQFQAELAVLQIIRYTSHFRVVPQCWESTQGGRTCGTPFLEAVKITNMALLHRTEAEALALPLSLAIHDSSAIQELKGKIKIPNEAEYTAMAVEKSMSGRRN